MLIKLYRTKWIKINGYKYEPPLIVLTGFQVDDLPCFSQIRAVFIVEQEALATVVEYVTEGVHHHFHSYAIKCSGERHVIHLNKLLEPRPVNSHCQKSGEMLHVTLCSFVIPKSRRCWTPYNNIIIQITNIKQHFNLVISYFVYIMLSLFFVLSLSCHCS